jgi:hypothetical protein
VDGSKPIILSLETAFIYEDLIGILALMGFPGPVTTKGSISMGIAALLRLHLII